jgi:hypothetical protein
MTGVLDTDTSGWSKGFQKAGQDMAALDKQSKGFIKDIKGRFGEESGFGQAFKIAAGTGAVAGLTLAAREFENLTGKIAATADAFRRGETTSQEFFAESARGLPVIGSLVKGFDNIREAITGEQAAMEAQEQAWKDTKDAMDAARKARDEYDARGKEGIAAFGRQADSAGQSAALAGMPEGVAKDLKAIQYDTQNKLHQLNDDFAKYASTDAIAALEKQLAGAKQGIADNLTNEPMRQEFLEQENNINQQLQVLYANRAALAGQYQEIRTAIEAEGYAKSQQAQAKAATEQSKTLEDQTAKITSELSKMADDAQQHGQQIAASLQTPLEKFQERMADLQASFRNGSIGGDIFARGALKAQQEFDATRRPPALRAVQAEELRGDKFVTAADVGGGQKEANELARKQLEKQIELLGVTKQQIRQAEQDVTVSIS